MPLEKIKFNSYPIAAALLVAGVVYLDYPKTPDRGAPASIGDYAQVAVDRMDFWIPLVFHLVVALAVEAGYQTGETPVSAELVDAVLSKHLDDLEPTLARHGYRLRDLVEQFEAKPAEIKAWFGQQLEPVRAAELGV